METLDDIDDYIIHTRRCHLAQAWWRVIQNLGLACHYKDKN